MDTLVCFAAQLHNRPSCSLDVWKSKSELQKQLSLSNSHKIDSAEIIVELETGDCSDFCFEIEKRRKCNGIIRACRLPSPSLVTINESIGFQFGVVGVRDITMVCFSAEKTERHRERHARYLHDMMERERKSGVHYHKVSFVLPNSFIQS